MPGLFRGAAVVAAPALADRNYRLYFLGQLASTTGTWIQQVALAWLAYRLTGSPLLLGTTQLLSLAPNLLVGPLVGVWADRHDPRRGLLVVQSLLASHAILLAGLTATHLVGPSVLLAMALVQGVLTAIDTPLRQTSISVFVVDRTALPNALALNAMLLNLGRFVGPPIAGLLLVSFGAAVCFALNGLSFLAMLVALIAMRGVGVSRAAARPGGLRDGLVYALNDPPIRLLLLTPMVLNATAASYAVLLPIFARHLGSDSRALGYLWGAAGLGAFAATLFLAGQGRRARPLDMIRFTLPLCAGGALAVAMSGNVWLTGVALACVGFGITGGNVSANVLLQTSTKPSFRGRVIALYLSGRLGCEAFGGFLVGLLASMMPASETLGGAAVVLGIYATWFLTRGSAIARHAISTQ